MDFTPLADTITILAHLRARLAAHPDRYLLVGRANDVVVARASGKLGVAFDLEGVGHVAHRAGMVALLHHLGVRSMTLTYNQGNALAGGCADEDAGLTESGRQVVAAMNEVGMLVDCAHAGRRASLEIVEASKQPVIFSHVNPAALWDHFRNVTDEQIRACAATDGVIGISGVNWFLGDQQARAESIVRHIDYVAQLVGPAHVGLGLDYVVDQTETQEVVQQWPHLAPRELGSLDFAPPAVLPQVACLLLAMGYDDGNVRAVMGENFLRVARHVWA
jgi:membrane dipeptidase